MDPQLQQRIVEVVENIVDNVLNDLRVENEILEELNQDYGDEGWDDDEDGNNEAGKIEGYLELLNAAQRAATALKEVLLEDFALLDDEEDFFFEDDNEVLDREFQQIRIQRYYNLHDGKFVSCFRMRKDVFEVLVQEFGRQLVEQDRLHRLRTGLDVCLLMALWIMGNLCSFQRTADVFGVSRSVVHFHYTIVIEALRELAPKFIKWPSVARRNQMKATIERRSGYPRVVGMMDGTLVSVTAPSVQKERYFDRHHKYSYNVLFICDEYMTLSFAYVGEAGSTHDSRVFQRSPLHDLLLERPDLLSNDEHILADGAYTLTNKVLGPYRDNGRLSRRQRIFNFIHSGIRLRIEHTNGCWKERWRRLYRFHVKSADYAVDHMMACAMLHNFVLLGGREPDGTAVQLEAPQNDHDIVAIEHPLLNAARRAGRQKRDAIALWLHPENQR